MFDIFLLCLGVYTMMKKVYWIWEKKNLLAFESPALDIEFTRVKRMCIIDIISLLFH